MSDKTKRLRDDELERRRFLEIAGRAKSRYVPPPRCPCDHLATWALTEKAGTVFFCEGCKPAI